LIEVTISRVAGDGSSSEPAYKVFIDGMPARYGEPFIIEVLV
jgi:hypothetical protein